MLALFTNLILALLALVAVLLALLPYLLALVVLLALFARAIFPKPALVTIPYSHYVELARWALDASRIRYSEIKYPVGPHSMLVPLIRCLFHPLWPGSGPAPPTAKDTSFPGHDVEQTWWSFAGVKWARRLAGVPCFIDEQRRLHPDSWAVLRLGGFTVDEPTREVLDDEVGPDVRRIMYHHLFRSSPELYRRVQSCGAVEMALFDLSEAIGATRPTIQQWLGTDETAVRAAEERLRARFQATSDILTTDPYLGAGAGDDDFGGADLAWAALTALLFLPPKYGNGQVDMATADELPADYRAFQAELLETRAGKHTLACYERHR